MNTSNRTDIIGMHVAKVSDVSFVTENHFNSTCQVVFGGGGAWIKVSLTIGTMIFSEKKVVRSGPGYYYEQKFAGSLPAKERVSQSNVLSLFCEPVIVRLDLQDGSSLIVGSSIHQRWLRIETDLRSAQNEVIVSFEKNALYPAFELDV